MIPDVTKNVYHTYMYTSRRCCIYTKEIWIVFLSELGAEPEREASFSGFQYLSYCAHLETISHCWSPRWPGTEIDGL